MKSYKNALCRTLALVAFAAIAAAAWAIPAKPGLIEVKMADGTTIKVRIVGDEWGHYYLSEDGYLLTRGEDDCFYYSDYEEASGRFTSTGVRASDVSLRTADELAFVAARSKQLPESIRQMPLKRRMAKSKRAAADNPHNLKDFPTTGSQNVLAILVQFKDRKFTVEDPEATFHDFMMEEGFTHDNGAHFSVRDYYTECSGGLFDPHFDIYGPVTLSQNLAYYGGNDVYGNDSRPEEMVVEACQLLDGEIDFSQYDRNGDGWVDNVYIFYAGYSEAEGASANAVWPHSWDLWTGAGVRLVLDGVQIGPYGCSQELNIENDKLVGIGVFCHEFGHVLGLPDLYDTGYTGLAFTPGMYSLMDAGEYADDSNTPPYLTAYERWVLGWHEPQLIDRAMNVTLPPVSGGTITSYMIQTTDADEMYILENRQQQGYDEFIPGHGMLVWHIDFDEDAWSGNTVNNLSTHQHIDIVEADGLATEATRAGDPFPGTAGVTSFTDTSYPSMRDWAGNDLGLPITEIAEEGGNITFKVLGGVFELDAVRVNPAEDISATSMTLSWTSVARATDYLLNLYVMNGAEKVYVRRNASVGNVNRTVVTGLEPETTYYATISATDGSHLSAESNTVAATTLEPDFSFYVPTVLEASSVTDRSFVANWEPLDGATAYYLSVFLRNNSGELVETIDFGDAASSFPDGWTTNCNGFIITDGCFGVAAPALSMRQTGAYVASPLYEGEIKEINFWYKGDYMDPNNIMTVSVSPDGSSWELFDYLDIASQTGNYALYGEGQSLQLPEGTRQFRLVFEKADGGTGGFVYVDDIRVVVEGTDEPLLVEGYDALDVGGELSHTVTGLMPGTDYVYQVKATDGTLVSMDSPLMSVRTSGESGVDDVAGDGGAAIYAVDGRLVVETVDGARVDVYALSGVRVAAVDCGGGRVEIDVPHGVYIVKCGGTVAKVLVGD